MAAATRSPIGCTIEQPSPATFKSWCAKNKIIWKKCKIGMSETTGRCVLAAKHIKAGEVVVEVPDDAVLMAEDCSISQLLEEDGLVKPAEDALLEVQGLILAVMYERSRGSQSRWGPYLAFLPQDLSHMPVYWKESELQELRGTAAWDKMEGRVQHPADAPTRVQQLFEELVLPFVQSHEAVCRQLLGGQGPDDMDEEAARKLLWSQYQWATSAVASYSFVLGDQQYQGMVAVWDLLNHVTSATNVRLHHDPDRCVLQMIATEDIPKGAECVNCYGRLSNAELLRGYGYVEQDNSHKHVQVPAQFLIRAAAAVAAKTLQKGEGSKATKTEAHEQQQEEKEEEEEDALEEAQQSAEGSSEQDADDDDEASEQEDDSSSSEEEDEEPDWDLEDDSEAEQQQQQQHDVPSLAAAQQQIPDWEDRWQLCHSMKLLPKNGVFQVASGGPAALPSQLLPVLLLLLADERVCEQLAAKAGAAAKAAKAAAAAAASSKAAGATGSRRDKKKKRTQKSGRQGGSAAEGAAAEVAVVGVDSSDISVLKFISSPGLLLAALQLLVKLMQCRYTCSLEQDRQLLQQQQLAPRLAAAVMARVVEKEVLAELQQALQQPGAVDQVMGQAHDGIRKALQEVAAAAAAAAADNKGGGEQRHSCHVPGCQQDDDHEHEAADGDKEGQAGEEQSDPRLAKAAQSARGSKRTRKQVQQQQQEDEQVIEQQEGGGLKQRGGKKRRQHSEAAATDDAVAGAEVQQAAAAAVRTRGKKGGSSKQQGAAAGNAGFAFNFAL